MRNTKVAMLPVVVHVPVFGSYSSVPVFAVTKFPPATSTWPLGSSVAVWKARGVLMRPVVVHVPLVRSYSSALSKMLLLGLIPPATSTWPLGSSVAV